MTLKPVKDLLTNSFPKHFFGNLSFSQDGEDMVLKSFFRGRQNYKGFYVDVGAHHPARFSNTYHFYLNGWRGINIDPTPNSMKSFNARRKRDINLEIAISNKTDPLTFHIFNEPAINGFNKEISEQRNGKSYFKLLSTKEIIPLSLRDVLDQYLPQNQTIDFLTIDVEGEDYNVLLSNDWNKYKPEFVLIEALVDNSSNTDDIYYYLHEQGYVEAARTVRTLIFKLKGTC